MSATLRTAVPPAAAAAILALTLWGEAAGRPVRGIEGIASVVMNRHRAAARPDGPRHLGQGIAGICRAPFQFPCWHPGSPRQAAMRAPGTAGDAAMAICRRVALRALAGVLPDATDGATHYHPGDTLPRWAIGQVATAELGGLVFYRLVG